MDLMKDIQLLWIRFFRLFLTFQLQLLFDRFTTWLAFPTPGAYVAILSPSLPIYIFLILVSTVAFSLNSELPYMFCFQDVIPESVPHVEGDQQADTN